MQINEIKKIFNYVLTNKLLDNTFNIDILVDLYNIINRKKENNFTLTKDNANELINHFLKSNQPFTKDTPSIIIKNQKCIEKAIKTDINSINYLINPDHKQIISLALENNYVLSGNSPKYLKENYDIIINSLENNIMTYKYVYKIIKKEYPSIMIKYFKEFLLNDFPFDEEYLMYMPLTFLKDEKLIYKVLEKISNEDKTLLKKYAKLIYELIKTRKIKDAKSFIEYSAEQEYLGYKENNMNDYANIFPKICIELEENDNFEKALNSLTFLNKMKTTLDEKYNELINAMKIYHYYVHHNIKNTSSLKNTISKLSALYISKSKEDYIKETYLYDLDNLKEEYIPKKDHPLIGGKIIEHRQREKLKELYLNKDPEITKFINNLDYPKEMINSFINNKNYVIKKPYNYDLYKKYKESIHIINRLNSNFIKIDDKEVKKYKDVINYKNGKYYYDGYIFNKNELKEYKKYEEKNKEYLNLKRDIIIRSKKIDVDKEIKKEDLEKLKDLYPFTDEYFELDPDVYSQILFKNVYEIFDNIPIIEKIQDDNTYKKLLKYLPKTDLIWKIMNHSFTDLYEIDELTDLLNYFINNIEVVQDTSIKENLNRIYLNNIGDISKEILGENIILKLITDKGYNFCNASNKEKIEAATSLACNMIFKDKSTVPYIKGQTENYQYSMYDDAKIILSGINTDACFRIYGNDHDFLNYCALDKNGFVIKITNTLGEFVARASGFRNGNSVYINQLRTIYDEGGLGFLGKNKKEINEIIKTFKKACDDIIEISQNSKEERKIQNVFVTKSYALKQYDKNIVDDYIKDKIGIYPMEMDSEDWLNFKETDNLLNPDPDIGFTTDYGNYDVICMSSIEKNINDIDIISYDANPIYKIKNKIKYGNNKEIEKNINKIKAIYCYFNNDDFVKTNLDPEDLVIYTNTWFIIYNNGIKNYINLSDNNKFKEIYNLLNEEKISKEKIYKII